MVLEQLPEHARHTGQSWCDNLGSSAHGYATLVVARESETMFVRVLNVINRCMNTADMGTKHLRATPTRILLVLMPLCYGGVVTMVSASREAGKTSSATTPAYAMVLVGVLYLCMHKVKITQRCRRLVTLT